MHDKGSLNRCYRLVWNALRGVWQVAPETARGRGKSRTGRSRRRAALLPLAAAALASMAAQADPGLPGAGQVVAGSGSISRSPAAIQVHQASDRLAIDWQSFSIGAGRRVQFVQPSASAVALNRVVGADPAVIQGSLSANGQVFLLNPNGVLFTPTAQVQVGALTASTLALDNDSFMAGGRLTLQGGSRQAVVNQGSIRADRGGSVALVAARIVNTGRIDAPQGQVLMGAGSVVTLDLGGPVKLQVSQAALDALIDNGGAVRADGGLIYLQARAAGALTTTVINQTGTLEARSLATGEQGQIMLLGDMANGRIEIGGRLDASAPAGGHGGFIETSAATVDVRPDVQVTTAAARGRTGEWLIDPYNITVAASGGNVTGTTLSNALATNNVTLDTTYATYGTGAAASGTAYTGAPGAGVGNITVNDAITRDGAADSGTTLKLKAHRDIQINQPVTATSGRLNVVLVADQAGAGTGSISFGPSGRVVTNGGNFYVGNVSGTWDETLAPTAQHFTMANGSFVDVGTGNLGIAVKGDISLPDNSAQDTTFALRALRNDGTRYFQGAGHPYLQPYGQYIALTSSGASVLAGRPSGGSTGSITTANTDPTVADIVTGVDLRLAGGNIGGPAAPLRISGPPDPYGLLTNPLYSRTRFADFSRRLGVYNTEGSSFLAEIGTQIFDTVEFTLGSQRGATQRLHIMGDTNGRGHLLLNTDGSGVLTLAAGDIDTSGVPGVNTGTADGTDPSVYPTSVTLSATSMRFASGAVNVGGEVLHAENGAGSAFQTLGTTPYAATFNATASSMAGGSADGVADIRGVTIHLRAGELGTAPAPLELAGNTTLSLSNSAGSTFVKVVDDSVRDITLQTVKSVGEHHVLWSGGDHIDFSTDALGTHVPTIAGGASDGATFGSTQGISLTRQPRNLEWLLYSGVFTLDTQSVDLAGGTFKIQTPTINADRVAGKLVYATHAFDGQPELTAGDVEITIGNVSGPAAGVADIEFAKGGTSSTNALTLSSFSGDIALRELSGNHFKSISVSLDGSPVAQNVSVDLAGPDDLAFSDTGSTIVLDATAVRLNDNHRNFSLSTGQRAVRIDSTALGSGHYSVYGGSGVALNGDVLTDGGDISLRAGGTGLTLLRSVRVDSNADDNANTASTGAAGSIMLTGTLSASAAGRDLTVDAGSSTQAGGTLFVSGNADSTSGAHLRHLTLTTKGATDGDDGRLSLATPSIAITGNFTATGDTAVQVNTLSIDTEQGDVGHAGHIRFAGTNLALSPWGSTRLDASTQAAGGHAGDIDLAGTVQRGATSAPALTVLALGGPGGSGGAISLPAIGTTSWGTLGPKTVSGRTVTLYGNLSTHGQAISLDGDVLLAADVTLDTLGGGPPGAAGSVSISGSLQGTEPGRALVIDAGSSGGDGGSVLLDVGHGGGTPLGSLRVTATGNNTAAAASIGVTGMQTSGSQSYHGASVTLNGTTRASAITVRSGVDGTSLSGSGVITADTLEIIGQGTAVDLGGGNGHKVGTLVASGVSMLRFLNDDVPLTVGAVGSTQGISATGPVEIVNRSADITLAHNIATTEGNDAAVKVHAGQLAPAGQAGGGNVLRTGSAAVSTGQGGRYTIYTGGVDDSTGLADLVGSGSGRFRYNSDPSASNFSAPLGSGGHVIYREQPSLSLGGAGGGKTYDGQQVGTDPGWTANGLRNGDTDSSLVGTPGYAGSALTAVAAGDYHLTVTGLSSTLGYAVDSPASIYTIRKAPLTVTANDAQKTYDGQAYNGHNGVRYNGFASGDDAQNSLSGTLVYGGTAQGAVGAGRYSLTSTGLAGANYTVTHVDGTLTVARAPLTVQAANLVKTYDRQPFSGGTEVTITGFVHGETAAGSLGGTLAWGGSAQGAVNAGSYAIAPSGLTADNYALNFSSGTLLVNRAPLTVTAVAAGKTYDAQPYSGGNGVRYSGFVNGDDAANSLTGSLQYGGSAQGAVDAGSYAIEPAGLGASNYTVSYVPAELRVTPAPLTVTARDAGKVYDAQPYGGGNGVDYGGFLGSDSAGGSLGGQLRYGGSAQGAVGAGSYAIAPAGLTAANYSLQFVPGTLTVAKAPLTVTAADARKVYDAQAYGGGNGVRYSGFAGDDSAAGSLGGSLVYGGSAQGAVNAGSYTITPSGLSAANYALQYVDGSLQVDRAPLTVAPADARKVYDGLPYNGGNGLGFTGLAGNDTGAGSVSGQVVYGGSAQGAVHAGSHTLTASGLGAANYTIRYEPGTLTVEQAPLTVTANSLRKVYDGLLFNGGHGVAYAGFVGSEGPGNLDGNLVYGGTAQGALLAGDYSITAAGLSAANYALRFVDGNLRIDSKPVPVTTAIARGESPLPPVPVPVTQAVPSGLSDGLALVHVGAPPGGPEPGATPAGRGDPGDAELRTLGRAASPQGAPRLVVVRGGIRMPATASASPATNSKED